ncbi:MAG TPA: hypothetical protein VGS62_09860 [Streptosporangiaceae bacterium]|nr:hypothetical protein [Streptosporangiaceae bacterium]
MHPRLLATRDCTGGSCPAVYDDDPDLRHGELAIVGKRPGAGLRARLTGRIAPDEELITIERSIVTGALRPPDDHMTPADFGALFETFSYSAFRLEAKQVYADTGRDDQWVTLLKASRRWGKAHQRVHVITEPLTPAIQQELTEGYSPSVAAGEDIGIIPVSDGGVWPDDVPRQDFWLFDGTLLIEMDYGPGGVWTGARHVRDPGRIIDACHAREAALHRATSWHTYIASRPDLQRRVAQ